VFSYLCFMVVLGADILIQQDVVVGMGRGMSWIRLEK
jgi:hypothetical protein